VLEGLLTLDVILYEKHLVHELYTAVQVFKTKVFLFSKEIKINVNIFLFHSE